MDRPKPDDAGQEFELSAYKFQPFTGEDREWPNFKKQLVAYLNAKGVSRNQLKKFVSDYRTSEE